MCHMDLLSGYVSHGKHGLLLTPTLRVCVTCKTWTLFKAYPEGICHMENMDFCSRLPCGYVPHGKHGLYLTPTRRVWRTCTFFKAYPAGMCHMDNVDFLDFW